MIDEFPLARDQVSSEWIGRCLDRSGIKGAWPESIRLADVAEIGQTADAYIIHLEGERLAAQAPRTLFAKTSPSDKNHRLAVHDLGLYARELSFYRDFGHDPGIPIPAVYFANIDPDSGHFFILMENLGETCRQGDMWRASLRDVEASVGHLAAFHAHWWQHARVLTSRWLAPNDALHHFDAQVVPMLGTLSKLLTRKYGPAYNDYLRYTVEHLGDGWERAWSTDPFEEVTLLHGDFHPKELFFGSSPASNASTSARVVATDWQSTCVGTPGVDLHRVVLAGLKPEDLRSHQARLLHLYWELMTHQGIALNYDALVTDTRRSMLLAVRNWLFSVAFTDQDVLEKSASRAGSDFRKRLFDDFGAALEHNRIHELLETSARR